MTELSKPLSHTNMHESTEQREKKEVFGWMWHTNQWITDTHSMRSPTRNPNAQQIEAFE